MSAARMVQEISIERDGRTWRGSYVLEAGRHPGITVSSDDFGGRKYAALHASKPDTLARIMLGELVTEGVRLRAR